MVAFCLFFSVCAFFSVFCFSLIATVPFAGYFLSVLFGLVSLLVSERVPGWIWFSSVYLVTTAGYVADQLM